MANYSQMACKILVSSIMTNSLVVFKDNCKLDLNKVVDNYEARLFITIVSNVEK